MVIISICFKAVCKAQNILPDVLHVLSKGKLLLGFRSDETRALDYPYQQGKNSLANHTLLYQQHFPLPVVFYSKYFPSESGHSILYSYIFFKYVYICSCNWPGSLLVVTMNCIMNSNQVWRWKSPQMITFSEFIF